MLGGGGGVNIFNFKLLDTVSDSDVALEQSNAALVHLVFQKVLTSTGDKVIPGNLTAELP